MNHRFGWKTLEVYSSRKKPEISKKKGKPKHPTRVHVWGGIRRRGATELLVLDGIMKTDFFTNSILRDSLLPFVREKYRNDEFRLIQDNDPKHASRASKAFLIEHGIEWQRTPAESPDLNSIEHMWHQMKHFIRNTHTHTHTHTHTQISHILVSTGNRGLWYFPC